MKEVIDEERNDGTTAFSHCISADFSNQRAMSAGVAVIFRREFQRPSKDQQCTPHLAFQDNEGKAGVYSLITKPQYFLKPSPCDYDKAFKDLEDDFKARGFKRLICSPMGCIRNKVPIKNFIKNLMDSKIALEQSLNSFLLSEIL